MKNSMKNITVHLEPDSSKWGLYGFERRGEELCDALS